MMMASGRLKATLQSATFRLSRMIPSSSLESIARASAVEREPMALPDRTGRIRHKVIQQRLRAR